MENEEIVTVDETVPVDTETVLPGNEPAVEIEDDSIFDDVDDLTEEELIIIEEIVIEEENVIEPINTDIPVNEDGVEPTIVDVEVTAEDDDDGMEEVEIEPIDIAPITVPTLPTEEPVVTPDESGEGEEIVPPVDEEEEESIFDDVDEDIPTVDLEPIDTVVE